MSAPISGRMSKLKPWHYAVIGGVAALCIALIPTLSRLMASKKAEDMTAATMAGNGGGGEAWHAPDFPAPEVAAAAYKPTMTDPPAAPQIVVAEPPAAIVAPAAPSGPSDYRMFGQRSTTPQDALTASGQATRVASSATPDGSMGALLKPTETTGYSATRIPHPETTIEQGRIIACNSVTPMTSQLPGFVRAKITYDVRSADGTTTLIDRNSDIFGEIAHGLAAGQDRLFVLWRTITTPPPDLVRITLNSPAADELGEAGLSGDVNNHMWKRIGGALLLSGVDALMQGVGAGIGSALSRGNSSGGGSSGSSLNFYQFQSQGSSLASSLLQNTIAIPDTLHRDQALPCSVFVSGDLSFESVYKLRRRTSAR